MLGYVEKGKFIHEVHDTLPDNLLKYLDQVGGQGHWSVVFGHRSTFTLVQQWNQSGHR